MNRLINLTVLSEEKIKRFWCFVDKKTDNECWEWLGNKDPHGYGRMYKLRAHRISAFLAGKDISKFPLVRHTCNNPSCVNPNHLVPSTTAENMQDKVKAGKSKYKFNEAIHQEIKEKFPAAQKLKKVSALAKEYGINRCYLYRLIKK